MPKTEWTYEDEDRLRARAEREAFERGRRAGLEEACDLLRPDYPDAVSALKRRALAAKDGGTPHG